MVMVFLAKNGSAVCAPTESNPPINAANEAKARKRAPIMGVPFPAAAYSPWFVDERLFGAFDHVGRHGVGLGDGRLNLFAAEGVEIDLHFLRFGHALLVLHGRHECLADSGDA